MGREEAPGAGAPGGMAPSARRRPGYPSVGLLASRARLRLTRQPEDSASGRGSKEAQGGKQQQEVRGREDGAMAAPRRGRHDVRVARDGPGLPVLLVMVRVP